VARGIEIGLEAIAGALGVEGVEDDYQAVVRAHALPVANHRRRDQVRLAVVHACGDVHGIVVIDHVDLGALAGLGLIAGADLVKVGDHLGLLPHSLIYPAVDDRRRGHAHGSHLLLGHHRCGGHVLGRGCGGQGQGNGGGKGSGQAGSAGSGGVSFHQR